MITNENNVVSEYISVAHK